jgi:hypothetical protein
MKVRDGLIATDVPLQPATVPYAVIRQIERKIFFVRKHFQKFSHFGSMCTPSSEIANCDTELFLKWINKIA